MAYRKKSRANATGRNDKLGRFCRLPHEILHSESYRSLGLLARSLLIELSMLENGRNNGSLYLSLRDATDRLGLSDQSSVSKGFDELIDRGLIVCSKDAHFAIKAAEQSRARCWRLTWLPCDNRPPSNEWRVYQAPTESKERKRAIRGQKALKRYNRALSAHRLPVLESRAQRGKSTGRTEAAALDSSTDIEKNGANPPILVARNSKAQTAVTITRATGEWWRDRQYLRVLDIEGMSPSNDLGLGDCGPAPQ